MAQWMDLSWSSNRYIRSYYNGFVDISGGNLYLRGFNTGTPNSNCHLYINNGDISLNGRMYASGDVSINSRLFVGADVSFNNRLFVGSDVSINQRLYVGGDTIIYGRLSVNEYRSTFIINTTTSDYTMIIAEDMSLNGRLTVYLDTSMNSRLFVGGDVSLNSRLIVYSDVSFNTRLFVGGDVSLNSRLTVYSDVSFNSRLFLGNDVSLNGSLFVSNYVGIGVSGSMFQLGISGGTTVCQLDVSGVSNFRGPVYPVTLVDNSVLLSNNREFDFSNNFGILWSSNPLQKYWSSIAISANGQFQIASDYGTSSTSYATSYIYVSNNYGLSWRSITSITNFGCPFISVSISSSGQYMIALLNATTQTYYYTSNDYGVTWTQSVGSINSFQLKNIYASAMSSTGQYQVFLQNFSNNTYFIYLSNNYGNSFNNTFTISNPNNYTSIAISSTGQYITACGNSGIYNSNNFGNYWSKVSSVSNFSCITLSATGQYQYCCVNSGQIYYSNNYGIIWTLLSASPSGTWKSITVSSNGQYVAAAQKSGNIYTSNNFGNSWTITKAGSKSWNSIAMSSNGNYITACASEFASSLVENIYSSVIPYANVSVSNLLVCYNDASFNNRLIVGNSTSLGGTVDISGNTTIGTPTVNGFLKVNGTFAVIGGTNTTTLNGATTINNTLNVTGLSSVANVTANSLQVNNSKSISDQGTFLQWNKSGSNGSTYIINQKGTGTGGIRFGHSTISDAFTQDMFLDETGNLTTVGGLTVTSINASGATSIANTLSVTGANATSLGGSLTVTGETTLNGTLTVSGANTTTLNGATSIANTLSVTGANATSLGGSLGVTGATTLSSTLDVTGATKLSSTLGVTGATTLSSTLGVTGAVTMASTLGVTSSCTAASFNATSDYRIKEVLQELDESFTVDNIRPIEYITKQNNKKNLGVIAHELQELYPCLVTGVKDGEELQTVNYIGLIPILVNEIKNLKKNMKVLKTELENFIADKN